MSVLCQGSVKISIRFCIFDEFRNGFPYIIKHLALFLNSKLTDELGEVSSCFHFGKVSHHALIRIALDRLKLVSADIHKCTHNTFFLWAYFIIIYRICDTLNCSVRKSVHMGDDDKIASRHDKDLLVL